MLMFTTLHYSLTLSARPDGTTVNPYPYWLRSMMPDEDDDGDVDDDYVVYW